MFNTGYQDRRAYSEAASAIRMLLRKPDFMRTQSYAEAALLEAVVDPLARRKIRKSLRVDATRILFDLWLLFDVYISSDCQFLWEALIKADERTDCSRRQAAFLEGMGQSCLRPYEVYDTNREAMVFDDLWDGGDIAVEKRPMERQVARGSMFFARLTPGRPGIAVLQGPVLRLKPDDMREVLLNLRRRFKAKQARRPHIESTAFFKEVSPSIGELWLRSSTWPSLAVGTPTDGIILGCLEVLFDIVDVGSLEAALDNADEFERVGNRIKWLDWRIEVETGGRAILGDLEVTGRCLTAVVASEEKVEHLRLVLGQVAPETLRYRFSEVKDFAGMLDKWRAPSAGKANLDEDLGPV
jgi:hypothetical protein